MAPPWVSCNAQLIPNVIALVGADPPASPIRGAAPFQTTLYFAAQAAFPANFKRDLLISLGDGDIGRVTLDLSELRPGEIATRTLDLYVPRGMAAGPAEVRLGFLRDGAPGEMKREDWTYRRAAAYTVEVAAAQPLEALSSAERETLLKSRVLCNAPNLLRNGSFDGWDGWRIDRDIAEGRGGWNRVLRERLDAQTFVEAPFALRLDFMGGQDPNYYGLAYDIEVRPATHYTLSYLIRTENITSEGLPCVEVTDAKRPIDSFCVMPPPSQRFRGTTPWREVSFSFATPSDTKLLRIKIRRHGSGPAEYRPECWGPINGSVWFDAIRLVEGRS